MTYTQLFCRVLAMCHMLGERRPYTIQSYVDQLYRGEIPKELKERYEQGDPSLAGLQVILASVRSSSVTVHGQENPTRPAA